MTNVIGNCQLCNAENVELIFGICADLNCVVPEEGDLEEEE